MKTRSAGSVADQADTRLRLRRIAAALCGVIAAVYALIGAEVVTVVEATEEATDIAVFGFGSAALFVVGAVLLLTQDRRRVWVLGAALQAMVIAMYFAVGPDRTPSFEAWGLGLRIPQLALLAILTVLALRPAGEAASPSAVDEAAAREFLAQRHIAVVGASDAKDNFGRTVYEELKKRDYDVVAVTTAGPTVLGDLAYADLREVPGPLDGVIVMVRHDRALPVVETVIALEIPRVWLFRGVGGAGAVSEEAVEIGRRAGITVIAGACPLMFLEPTAAIHRIHRGVRRANGSLARSA